MNAAGKSAPRWDYTAADHAELIAWEAAEDALRGSSETCGPNCYDPATMEFGPGYPCDNCRSRELAEIDRDGYDDKTETPGLVA